MHLPCVGDELTLRCDVDSNPKPDIVWLRDGDAHVLGKQATYVIPKMSLDHAGRYFCRASVPGFQVSAGGIASPCRCLSWQDMGVNVMRALDTLLFCLRRPLVEPHLTRARSSDS